MQYATGLNKSITSLFLVSLSEDFKQWERHVSVAVVPSLDGTRSRSRSLEWSERPRSHGEVNRQIHLFLYFKLISGIKNVLKRT